MLKQTIGGCAELSIRESKYSIEQEVSNPFDCNLVDVPLDLCPSGNQVQQTTNLSKNDECVLDFGHEKSARTEPPKPTNDKPPFPMAGLVAAVVGSISYSSSLLLVRLIPDGRSLQERTKQLIFRGLLLMLFPALSIIAQKSTFLVEKNEIKLLISRLICGYCLVYFGYISLSYISFGEAQAIIFTAPVWTTILGYLILGEKLSLPIILGLPIGVLGTILIATPNLIIDMDQQVASSLVSHQKLYNISSETINKELDVAQLAADSYFATRWPGIAAALGASFSWALVCIVLRYRKSTPVQTTTFHLGLFTVLVSLLIAYMIGFGRWPDSRLEWLLLFGNGLLSWVGQTTFQWAAQYEKASVIAMTRAIDLVMGFLYSVLLLDDVVLWTSVLGSTMILAVVTLIMTKNYLDSKQDERRKP